METAKKELERGISRLVDISPEFYNKMEKDISFLISNNKEIIKDYLPNEVIEKVGDEGFLIRSHNINDIEIIIIIYSKTDRGILYGSFRFLSLLQMEKELADINIISNPTNLFPILIN